MEKKNQKKDLKVEKNEEKPPVVTGNVFEMLGIQDRLDKLEEDGELDEDPSGDDSAFGFYFSRFLMSSIVYIVITVIVFICVYLKEESMAKDSFLRNSLLDLLKQRKTDILLYFAENPQLYKLPEEIPQVDYKNISKKEFLKKYIQSGQPCLLKDYGKQWPAYEKWQNISYLIEKAGNEIVYLERAPLDTNQFAYFKQQFKKQYMTYEEYYKELNNPNREFNYYFAQEKVPLPLENDVIEVHFGEDQMVVADIAYWHGIGTVSLPHTDGDENFMCVFKGYKNFTIVSPYHSYFVYPGVNEDQYAEESMPPNYSPVDFDNPDYEKYPMFKKAKVYKVKVDAGDCLFLPSTWWHQVTSSPEECIAVSTWYQTNQVMKNMMIDHRHAYD